MPSPAADIAAVFAAAFAALPAAVALYAVTEPEYPILAVSDALAAAAGRPRAALVGRPLADAFPDADSGAAGGLASLRASLEAAVQTGEAQRMPQQRYDLQRPDGTWETRYWDAVNIPVRAADGVVRHVLHQTEDVTARVLGAEAQARAERRVADVLDRVADAHFVLDRDFRVVAANPAAERACDRPRAALLGRTYGELFPASVDTDAARAYRRVMAGGVAEHLTQHYVGEGHDVHLEIDAYPTDEGGVAIFWRDVTPRVRAEAALASGAARQRFLLALDDRLRPLADAEHVQYEAARLLGEHLGACRVGYAELEADDLHVVVGRHYVDGVQGVEGCHRVADYDPPLLEALRAGDTVVRADIAGMSVLSDAERAAHAALHIGAAVNVPLIKAGRLAAILFTQHRAARAWAPEELALAEAVAERTWDAVERARAEAALRASEARLRLALDVAGLGTWTWDLATGAGDLDARGAEIIGLPVGGLGDVATAQRAAIHPDDLAAVEAAVAAGVTTGAGGGPFDLAYRVVRADGDVRHVASRAQVLADDSGRPARLVGTNRDVTAERDAAAERERLLAAAEAERERATQARRAAEAANRSKSEFLAVMSHELRTPLNAIGGYAELIELGIHGPVTEGQRTALARIQQSQRHLMGLIVGVLDYSRVEAGAVSYRLADVLVTEAVGEAELLVAPQLRAKGLGYAWSGAPPGLCVRADREKLQQILLNLLSNAVKFTDARDGAPGRVEVACRVDPTRDNGSAGEGAGAFVHLEVRDTGMGIAAEELDRVFEPFVQVDQRLTRPHAGVGLGLAISRDLARGMGGDLVAQSMPGEGSVFTLVLPRA